MSFVHRLGEAAFLAALLGSFAAQANDVFRLHVEQPQDFAAEQNTPPYALPLADAETFSGLVGDATTGGQLDVAASAAIGVGFLQGKSSASFAGPGAAGGVDPRSAAETATFTLDDLVVSAPPGTPPGTQASYVFHYQIEGAIHAQVTPPDYRSGASAELSFATQSSSYPLFYDGGTLGELAIGLDGANPPVFTANGIFAGFPLDVQTSRTGDTAVDIYGDPAVGYVAPGGTITVTFTLRTGASASKATSSNAGTSSAYADFSKTFRFPASGPVVTFFDGVGAPLAGWTVDSSDGCIVDDVYQNDLCGPTAPEPAAGEAELAALVAVVALVRPIRRRAAR